MRRGKALKFYGNSALYHCAVSRDCGGDLDIAATSGDLLAEEPNAAALQGQNRLGVTRQCGIVCLSQVPDGHVAAPSRGIMTPLHALAVKWPDAAAMDRETPQHGTVLSRHRRRLEENS